MPVVSESSISSKIQLSFDLGFQVAPSEAHSRNTHLSRLSHLPPLTRPLSVCIPIHGLYDPRLSSQWPSLPLHPFVGYQTPAPTPFSSTPPIPPSTALKNGLMVARNPSTAYRQSWKERRKKSKGILRVMRPCAILSPRFLSPLFAEVCPKHPKLQGTRSARDVEKPQALATDY